jgi:spermidine/putrescine-binding protein
MKDDRRKWLSAAAGLTTAWMAGLTGCSREGGGSGSARQLKVFNWSDYIHEDVIPEFERRMDCTVVYDNYASDAELETRLATGGGAYDVVFPPRSTARG